MPTPEQKIAEMIREIVSHEIEVVTDSEWFTDLVEDKVREVMKGKGR